MIHRAKYAALLFATATALLSWGILHGQVQRSSPSVGGFTCRSSSSVGRQTVPEREVGAGTVVLRTHSIAFDDTSAADLSLDSLELRLLEIEIRERENRLEETSLLRRLLPTIHFSASYGIRDLAFIDPTSYTLYVLPRDAYRVTLSLTLNDVLFSPAYAQALVELEKLREMLAIRLLQQTRERRLLQQQLRTIQNQIEAYEKELALVQELLRFNQLRFEQGKIEFDVLTRTKIELLNLRRSLDQLHNQQSEIQLKLTNN